MGRRLTKELAKVSKLQLLDILKDHPDGLDLIKLMSKQWLHAPLPAPTLRRFRILLQELKDEGKVEERLVHGKGLIWRLAGPGAPRQGVPDS